VETYLKSLEADEKIKVVKQKRGLFYQLKKSSNTGMRSF
jgi:hypothetical protein